ncbi:MAG: 6,7-dimethyl-8-ribityllumazine synthase, partial [Nitrospinota bacterium]|nr:6,7-dimethyl-8-ribityllumazine synthase [Nitrospinota bacterium]
MANIIEGGLNGAKLRVGIVSSRTNDFIGERLLGGALDCLERHGVAASDIEVAKVPGAFEIPLAALRMAASKKY